jgi:hypothetical protein
MRSIAMNEPDSIMRARELYKAVIFLHGQDPEITPAWERRGAKLLPPFPWKSSAGNPAVMSQVNRARLGFLQINAGLNYYAVSPAHVPPVRFRVLKESADRFAAGARGAQSDFLSYVQQLDTLTVSEMNARTMVAKASAAISIAQEQQKIAEFYVGEAQKQVDAINGQIAAKIAEIAKKDEFFEQAKDFAGGMVDSMSKLGEMAFAGEGEPGAASASNLSTGDVLKLGYKVGTASNVLGAGSSALAGAAGVAGPFGAFLYAGVTSITAVADAIAKRAGELKQLQNVALPAAKALVDLKKRDITIAQLSQNIAKADWQLGKDLLAYFAQRLLNRSFLVSMIEFSNRLMRRYLDLAGRTAWIAERALAFEQDRELGIIAFDYFPRNLRGVSGADVLQLHLAELEAARIQGLTQTIPVKHTVSLARDYPMAFGQLKSTWTLPIHDHRGTAALGLSRRVRLSRAKHYNRRGLRRTHSTASRIVGESRRIRCSLAARSIPRTHSCDIRMCCRCRNFACAKTCGFSIYRTKPCCHSRAAALKPSGN